MLQHVLHMFNTSLPYFSARLPTEHHHSALLPVGAGRHRCAADEGNQRGPVPVHAGRGAASPGGLSGPRSGNVSIRPQSHGKKISDLKQVTEPLAYNDTLGN